MLSEAMIFLKNREKKGKINISKKNHGQQLENKLKRSLMITFSEYFSLECIEMSSS